MTDVSSQTVDGIAVITIDRPARANALRRLTIQELSAALLEAEEGEAHGAVIAGVANRFSAGADLDDLSGTAEDEGYDDELETLTGLIQRSPLVVLSAVEGICFGAGIDLAWSCDAVVVGRDARIALPAAHLGILYNPSSLQRLHSRLGGALLRRLVVVGEEVTGETIGTTGAGIVADSGTAVDTATALLGGDPGVRAAIAAAKFVLSELDAGAFDSAAWQETRRALLAAPSRSEALQNRKNELTQKNEPKGTRD